MAHCVGEPGIATSDAPDEPEDCDDDRGLIGMGTGLGTTATVAMVVDVVECERCALPAPPRPVIMRAEFGGGGSARGLGETVAPVATDVVV